MDERTEATAIQCELVIGRVRIGGLESLAGGLFMISLLVRIASLVGVQFFAASVRCAVRRHLGRSGLIDNRGTSH